MKKTKSDRTGMTVKKTGGMTIGRKFKTIDDYISHQPKSIQKLLTKVRAAVSQAAPDAEETISYNMPAYKHNGVLLYFAAHSSHIGFYPTSSGITAFHKELADYTWAKGSVQFPYDRPIPVRLIARMTKFRVKENALKASLKKKRK